MTLTQKVSSTSILFDISFSYVMCPMYIRYLSPAVKNFFPELFPQELPDAGAGLSVLSSWSAQGDERGRGNEDYDTITCFPDPGCTSQYPIYLSVVKREFANEDVASTSQESFALPAPRSWAQSLMVFSGVKRGNEQRGTRTSGGCTSRLQEKVPDPLSCGNRGRGNEVNATRITVHDQNF